MKLEIEAQNKSNLLMVGQARGGGCQGPRASSRDSAMEMRSSSEKGRPMNWTPMGRPSEEVEMGMDRPGRPARLSHCEWRMVWR